MLKTYLRGWPVAQCDGSNGSYFCDVTMLNLHTRAIHSCTHLCSVLGFVHACICISLWHMELTRTSDLEREDCIWACNVESPYMRWRNMMVAMEHNMRIALAIGCARHLVSSYEDR